MAPKSVTLGDLPWCNGRYFVLFYPNLVALGDNYVKVVKNKPMLSRQKCKPKNLVFSNVWSIAIFVEFPQKECI